ncbi:MAG: PIN domain-containing protein [bacterium]
MNGSRENIIISAQIINEVCVNLIKKAQFSEENIQELVTSFYEKYTVIDNCKKILIKASQLRKDNRFSFWDSIIIASALSSITSILYSEDMQDGFVVENKLRIENPFKNN